MKINSFLVFVCVAVLFSCNSTYTSKKEGFFKIPLPEHQYQQFARDGFPYSFEYPVYGSIVQDSTYFDATPENTYWINVDFSRFSAKIFLSYKQIGGKSVYKTKDNAGTYIDSVGVNKLENLINDAFTLTSKNEVVASYIKDSAFRTQNGINGVFFKVGGNAATSQQFFLTDSTKNFLRGALYFSATPNADSLRPVQDFLHQDILHFIRSFKWN